MMLGVYPFPFRTRKLSLVVPKILDWKRSGKIGSRQHREVPARECGDLLIYIIFYIVVRIWRNWQTRMVQVHVKAISCRFKSCYPHQFYIKNIERIVGKYYEFKKIFY